MIDHLPIVLSRIADAIDRISRGDWSAIPTEAAVAHAMARLSEGFEVPDVLTEFFLLRHVLLQDALASRASPDPTTDAQLLSWAVDSVIRESTAAFAAARQRTLKTLDRISGEAFASRSGGELLHRILNALVESIEAVDVSCVFLIEGQRLVHRIAVGGEHERHGQVELNVDEGIAGRVISERRPVWSTAEQDLSDEGAFLREHGIRAVYAVPLVWEDEVIGVMQCGSASVERLSNEDATLFRAAADRASAALRQQQLKEEAERVASDRDRALRDWQLALDAANMGWWRFDPVTRTSAWDARSRRMVGLAGDTAPIEEALRVIHPQDLPTVWRAIESALDVSHPQTFQAEYRVIRPDGTLRWIEARGRATFDGDGSGGRATSLVGTILDVTERRRAEDELREADRRKSEFIAVLSHELRNPLAPIKQAVYILERAAPGTDPAQRALGIIDRQIGHLTRLVDDLLDVTRIGRGKVLLLRERLDIVELVRSVIEDHRPILEGFRVSAALPDAPVWLEGDPTRLAQLLGNLLQNSAKFTPAGGLIGVELTRTDDSCELEVSDTGIGIAPEMLPKVFDAFAQDDRSLNRARGGLGLGLALVKGLVELHGGVIRCASAGPGQGSRFTITLPLSKRGGP